MEMSKFILRGDILTLQVRIDNEDYRFGVRWKIPEKPYDETWKLESYININTGKSNLKEEQIKLFMDTINAKRNWNLEDTVKTP